MLISCVRIANENRVEIISKDIAQDELFVSKLSGKLNLKLNYHSCQIDKASNRQMLEKNRQNRQRHSSLCKKFVTKH